MRLPCPPHLFSRGALFGTHHVPSGRRLLLDQPHPAGVFHDPLSVPPRGRSIAKAVFAIAAKIPEWRWSVTFPGHDHEVQTEVAQQVHHRGVEVQRIHHHYGFQMRVLASKPTQVTLCRIEFTVIPTLIPLADEFRHGRHQNLLQVRMHDRSQHHLMGIVRVSLAGGPGQAGRAVHLAGMVNSRAVQCQGNRI